MGLLLVFLSFPFCLSARAESVQTPHVKAELVSEFSSVRPGQKFLVGLRLEMEKHWHTYWRFPGDSGLPTKVKWELPEGWEISEPRWPLPSRILVPPLVNYGYDGEVVIGFEITAPASATPGQVEIKGRGSWLVCKEECIPGGADLRLPLIVGSEQQNPWDHFKKLNAAQAQPLPEGALIGIKLEGARIGLEFSNDPAWLEGKVDFFPLEAQLIGGTDAPKLERLEKTAVLWMEKAEPFSTTAKDFPGVLIVGEKVFELRAPLAGKSLPAAAPEESPSIAFAALLAFLGGILLNLMPCVFPVLGIKVMALVSQGGGNPWHSRKHGKVYVLGVVISFWILTGALLALRSAGESVGWGFQLQHPGFVIVMIFLFSFLSANLAGFLEFGGRFMGIGSNLAARDGYTGSFFTGMLAVVVATPCTAPFMGTAIGVVLAQPAWGVFLVFTALALGLGAPFLLLSYQPALLKALPRPGAWMERLKEFFAFPLAATVIWLFWVLVRQVGPTGLLYVAIALLCLFAAAWVAKRFGGWISRIMAGTLLVMALFLAWAGSRSVAAPTVDVAKDWKPYELSAVESARREGRAVFIDFTAAWCLTCQVNKALVLERPAMVSFFREKNVALFRADWTNSDPLITRALESYGRIGVPVYVAYGAGGVAPRILPQILTDEIVRQAF